MRMQGIDPTSASSLLRALLRRHARSMQVRRIVRHCSLGGTSHPEAALVAAIAVTEMSARPADARAIEWMVAIPLRNGFLGARCRRWSSQLTLGPFQMRDAPFRLKAAVTRAVQEMRDLRMTDMSLAEVARIWNGPMAETHGAVPYSDVLRVALELVDGAIVRNGDTALFDPRLTPATRPPQVPNNQEPFPHQTT